MQWPSSIGLRTHYHHRTFTHLSRILENLGAFPPKTKLAKWEKLLKSVHFYLAYLLGLFLIFGANWIQGSIQYWKRRHISTNLFHFTPDAMVTVSYGLNRLSDFAATRSVGVIRKAKSARVINEVIFTSSDCVIKGWVIFFFQSLAVQVLNKWWLGGGEQKCKRKCHCWSNTLLRSNSCHEKTYCRPCFLIFLCKMMTKHCRWFTGKMDPWPMLPD